mmetsp:Transcript_7792/g.18085  ORF Transcript_7792/g.18085 Transcript_7792/m.18085 type:complete len:804 (-) Transcript_7792:46-2457(-)
MQRYGAIPESGLPAPRARRQQRRTAAIVATGFVGLTIVCLLFVVESEPAAPSIVLLHAEVEDASAGSKKTALDASSSSSESAGGQTAITCLDVPTLLGSGALQYVSAFMSNHSGCQGELPAGCADDFVCTDATEEMLSTTSVWVRGTCGADPTVFAFHIDRTPDYVAERDNPVDGDVDTSTHLHSGAEKTKEAHRSALERLSKNYMMVQCSKVAASAADVAIDPKLVQKVNSANLGYKLQAYPHLLTKSKADMQSMYGHIPLSPSQLQSLTVLTDSSPELSGVTVPATYDATAVRSDCDANEIRNQETCGSCYAFASAKAFSLAMCHKSSGRYNIILSEQECVSCRTDTTDGCNGGNYYHVYTAQQAKPFSSKRCLPYQAKDADDHNGVPCSAACTDDLTFKPTTFYGINVMSNGLQNTDALKKALIKYTALYVGVKTNTEFNSYKSGVLGASANGVCNHAVTLVGWDADSWILHNSWGSHWGDNGKLRVGFDSGILCGTAGAVVPEVTSPGCPSQPMCENAGEFKKDCSCYCPHPYSGPTCGSCALTCQNGGTRMATGCACTCPEGYFGLACEKMLLLQWDQWNPTTKMGTMKVTYNLDSFHPSNNTYVNKVMRFTDANYNVVCSNCPHFTLTGKTGSGTFSMHMPDGWGGPDYQHCFAIDLSLGENEFGYDMGAIKVKFPCLYARPNSAYSHKGGRCLDGGHELLATNPLHSMMCSTNPPPTPTGAVCQVSKVGETSLGWNQYCPDPVKINFKCVGPRGGWSSYAQYGSISATYTIGHGTSAGSYNVAANCNSVENVIQVQ